MLLLDLLARSRHFSIPSAKDLSAFLVLLAEDSLTLETSDGLSRPAVYRSKRSKFERDAWRMDREDTRFTRV